MTALMKWNLYSNNLNNDMIVKLSYYYATKLLFTKIFYNNIDLYYL